MERICTTCKWFLSSNCICKDFINSVSVSETDTRHISFFEEGIFSEAIKEGININKLASNFTDILEADGHLKKRTNLAKVNFEPKEAEVYEYIEEMLYTSIRNYFLPKQLTEIKISRPTEFSCCYWV